METIFKAYEITRCENVQKMFFSLYNKWLNEYGHGGLSLYAHGKSLALSIVKNFSGYDITFVKGTSIHYGVIVKIDGVKYQFYVTDNGKYLILNVREYIY